MACTDGCGTTHLKHITSHLVTCVVTSIPGTGTLSHPVQKKGSV